MNPIELPKDKPFLKSESLKHLKLDNCNLTTIYAETFTELRNLESLNLNQNLIVSLPVNSFNLNSKLKSLLVESNRLRFFPDVIVTRLDELCIGNNSFDKTPDFLKLMAVCEERKLQTENCSEIVEFDAVATSTSTMATITTVGQIVKNFDNEGISDFFIGSYVTLIILVQATAFVLLFFYLIKIKYEKLDGDLNYANSILNDDEIYKAYKSDE